MGQQNFTTAELQGMLDRTKGRESYEITDLEDALHELGISTERATTELTEYQAVTVRFDFPHGGEIYAARVSWMPSGIWLTVNDGSWQGDYRMYESSATMIERVTSAVQDIRSDAQD